MNSNSVLINSESENKNRDSASFVMSLLPIGIRREIERICLLRKDFPESLHEIRIKCEGRSSLSLSGESIPLFTEVSENEMNELFDRITGGSPYAHVSNLREGFVSIGCGIRVGISGSLAERGGIPKRILGLVFRIPSGSCTFDKELLEIYKTPDTKGMLIYSLPGAGKTTALRALAGRISRELVKKVVVVDERREFIASDYKDAMVDILCGYRKERGLEIALRTLGAEVIIVDEIGSAEEGEALLRVGRGGVPIIASAHSGGYDEVRNKEGIAPLIREGYFNRFIHLFKDGTKFSFESD